MPDFGLGLRSQPTGRDAVGIVNYAKFTPERMIAAKLVNAERVNIRIQGYPALSGEYRVNGDGTIAVPGIGRFEIMNNTIMDFEAQLATEVARIGGRETSISIEVLDYRAVFISGLVARSGAFAWKPGLSVLHAEALAGGLARGVTPTGEATLLPSTDREKDRALRAAYELAATLATIARLRTEKNSEATFVAPARLATLLSQSDLMALSGAHQATLKSRNVAYLGRVNALKNAKILAQKELGALVSQRTRLTEQLAKRRATLQKIEKIGEQGFIRADRIFEDQVRLSELEERLTTTTIAISRIDAAVATAQQDLEVLVLGRAAEIDTEILGLEQKAGQLELDIESANDTYRRITGQNVLNTRDVHPVLLRYEIVRVEAGVSRVIKADRATMLEPGDVVMVSASDRI